MIQDDLDGARASDVYGLFAMPEGAADQTYRDYLVGSYDLKNRYWALLSGIVAPFFGTVVAVIIWCVFVFRFGLTLIGRTPRLTTRATRVMATTMAIYGLIHIATTLANSGLSGWEDCVPLLIFLAPVFVFPFALQSDGRVILHLFCVGSAVGTILAALVVAGQMLAGFPRVEGFLGNSAVFATILAISGTFGALSMRYGGKLFWLGVASFAAMLVCVISSQTRTLWLMIPVNIFFLAILMQKSVDRKTLLRISAAGAAMLVLATFLFAPMLERRFVQAVRDVNAIESHTNYDTSLGLRYVMWNAAVDAIAKRPVFGYGMTSAMDGVHEVMEKNRLYERNFTHPHNAFLFAMLNAGIFGLVSLIALLMVPLWLAYRSQAPLVAKLFITILIANYFVAGLPGLMLHHDILDGFFVTAILIGIAACAPLSAEKREAR